MTLPTRIGILSLTCSTTKMKGRSRLISMRSPNDPERRTRPIPVAEAPSVPSLSTVITDFWRTLLTASPAGVSSSRRLSSSASADQSDRVKSEHFCLPLNIWVRPVFLNKSVASISEWILNFGIITRTLSGYSFSNSMEKILSKQVSPL